jgi:predicted cobalt transporter CbtA
VIIYYVAVIALLAMLATGLNWTKLLIWGAFIVYRFRPNSFLNPQLPKRDFSKRERLVWLIGSALCAVTGFGISYPFWPDDPFQWMTAIMVGIVFWGLGFQMVRDLRFVLRHRQAAH